MKLDAFVLLMVCVCLQRVDCSLPTCTPATHAPQVEVSVSSKSSRVRSLMRPGFSRLPGLCRRLKRRRITVLCNLERFCWPGQNRRFRSGQVCPCPQGSRCLYFFIHSF